MATSPKLTWEIDIQPGGTLQLPQSLLESMEPGHWLLTLERVNLERATSMRDHSAFLNGYAPEDEGLYDDYPTR